MVASLLRELADPYGLHLTEWFWWLVDRPGSHLVDVWARVAQRVAETGEVEALHAARDDYHAVLIAHFKILDGCQAIASKFPEASPNPELAQHVARTREALQRHYDSLFPRWQTLEDLEAILLERVSVPNERLKELAARHRPPHSWYDEEHAPPAPRG